MEAAHSEAAQFVEHQFDAVLVASTDIGIYSDRWDVPGVAASVSKAAAATYPTPADFLNSFGLADFLDDQCATTDSGPYDDGTYVGNFVSADRCGPGSKAGYLMVVAETPGTDLYIVIEFNTITSRDVGAVDTILASLEVDPNY